MRFISYDKARNIQSNTKTNQKITRSSISNLDKLRFKLHIGLFSSKMTRLFYRRVKKPNNCALSLLAESKQSKIPQIWSNIYNSIDEIALLSRI